MKEISCFIDESGDYGEYDHRSPYYIVALVLHDQSHSISENIERLNNVIRNYDNPERAIHTAPLVRRESDYAHMDIKRRRKIFNCLFTFMRNIDIRQKVLVVEKRQINDPLDIFAKLSKQLFGFLSENIVFFTEYDRVVVYYDNGQIELTRILVAVFNTLLNNVEFIKIKPSEYKLAQVADLFCTLELLNRKIETKSISKSESLFFTAPRQIRKTYLSAMKAKIF
jgi:hypothetical protein